MPAKINHIHRRDTKIPLYHAYGSSHRMVCFKCRLCFHRPYNAGVFKCGTCKGPTVFAGLAFRAPRKNNVREWKKLQTLIEGGWTFGINGSGVLPSTPVEARKVVRRNKAYDNDAIVYARRISNGKRVIIKTPDIWSKANYPLP